MIRKWAVAVPEAVLVDTLQSFTTKASVLARPVTTRPEVAGYGSSMMR
jgi:hypothetical protein